MHMANDQKNCSKLLGKDSKFCLAPWTGLHLWPNGSVFPCCMYEIEKPVGNVRSDTLKGIWNGDELREVRRKMIAGETVEGCRRCMEHENVGLKSLRHHTNDRWGNRLPKMLEKTDAAGSFSEFKIPYIDFRFSNLCNYRCRTCSPLLSSGWHKDHHTLYFPDDPIPKGSVQYPQTDMEQLWSQVEEILPSLESIYFAGGEPLLDEYHFRILNFLRERKMFHIGLAYNTNLSIRYYKGHDLFEIWNEFENVNVRPSLDAHASRGEYIRKGQNWKKTVSLLRELRETCPRMQFGVTYTLSLLNAFALPEFHRSLVAEGIMQKDELNVNLLLDPSYFRLDSLPHSLKSSVESHLLDYLHTFLKNRHGATSIWNSIYSAIDFMYATDRYPLEQENFDVAINGVDQLRGESFVSTFPELQPMFAEQFSAIQ